MEWCARTVMLAVKIFLILSNWNTMFWCYCQCVISLTGCIGYFLGKKTFFTSLDEFQKMPTSSEDCTWIFLDRNGLTQVTIFWFLKGVTCKVHAFRRNVESIDKMKNCIWGWTCAETNVLSCFPPGLLRVSCWNKIIKPLNGL